jgi:hypothetical protein
MSEREPRYVVLVRPKGVGPSWWRIESACHVDANLCLGKPKVGALVAFAFYTVTGSGGFISEFDERFAVSGDVALGERVEAWFEAHEEDPWPWELCQVRLPD